MTLFTESLVCALFELHIPLETGLASGAALAEVSGRVLDLSLATTSWDTTAGELLGGIGSG